MICIHCGTRESLTMCHDYFLTCTHVHTKFKPRFDCIKLLVETMNTPNDIKYTILHGLRKYYKDNKYQIEITYTSNEHHQDTIGWNYFYRERISNQLTKKSLTEYYSTNNKCK